jgi:hypothetical protein
MMLLEIMSGAVCFSTTKYPISYRQFSVFLTHISFIVLNWNWNIVHSGSILVYTTCASLYNLIMCVGDHIQ